MPHSPQQRHAQRVIGAIVRGGASFVYEDGRKVWRHPDAGEWQADAEEIGGHLATLPVPYAVAIVKKRPRGCVAPVTGIEVWVATADLSSLVHWVPALQRVIDASADDAADH
jgi:hypothetical protein